MLALTACSSGEGTGFPAPFENPAPPAPLCVSSSCGSKTVLLEDIPSAENLFFTDSGRLFVSGGESVYEITRAADDAWQATPIFDGSNSFGGIAQVGEVLYVNGFDGNLYATRLTEAPQLAPIHALGLGSPNGLTAGPDGELYIVNGPIPSSSLPDPKIVRLRIDPADPLRIVEQSDWLATGTQTYPNGIQRRGRTLYFTESAVPSVTFGSVRTVDVLPDGSPGEPQTLGTFPAIADDLGLATDSILVTYYFNGQVAQMGADGSVLQSTEPGSFENPSSVRQGRPPLFTADQLVVTEKGVVGLPPTPGYGSKLSVFQRDP